jgi:HlyD family secretion protein
MQNHYIFIRNQAYNNTAAMNAEASSTVDGSNFYKKNIPGKLKNFLYLSILIFFCFSVFSCSTNKEEEPYTIRKGSFSASFVESGELQAVNNNVIVVPGINWRYVQQLKLTSLVDHGTKVKAGDVIAEIDKSSLMKTLFDMESRLEVEQTALDKLLIQQSTQREVLNTDVKVQEASFALAKLQMEGSKFESAKRQQITKMQFEKATIAMNKVQERVKANEITSKKNIFIQNVRVQQIKNNIKDVKKNLDYFLIKAPVSGMVEIRRNFETNTPLKVGDRVWPGYPIASVPDLTKMKVLAKINENDIGKLRMGQKTLVRLQAMPDQSFEGKVVRINPICYSPEEDSKVKVFDFDILLDKTETVLKPGMSVSCEVFFADYKKVLYIENECIVRNDSVNYIVLQKGHKNCPVTLGASNNKFTIVTGDFKEGDKVIPVKDLQTTTKP